MLTPHSTERNPGTISFLALRNRISLAVIATCLAILAGSENPKNSYESLLKKVPSGEIQKPSLELFNTFTLEFGNVLTHFVHQQVDENMWDDEMDEKQLYDKIKKMIQEDPILSEQWEKLQNGVELTTKTEFIPGYKRVEITLMLKHHENVPSYTRSFLKRTSSE